jgi:hypothetical protein
MKLSQDDVEIFYKLFHTLLVYLNKRLKILEGLDSREDIKKFSIAEIKKVRDRLYENPEMIDSFINENPSSFSNEELSIISSWKNFIKGSFIVIRYLKNYTIFLSEDEKTPKAYGVLALTSSFEEMFGFYLPIMVETVLLPFKNKIVYDSIFYFYRITFGSGIKRSFNDSYQLAKSQFGIITSLPFSPNRLEQSEANKLRFYLKNELNREKYAREILELIGKDKELLRLYHQEMGKIHSRSFGRRLHEIGLTKGWFAILEGTLISGGVTRQEVEQSLKGIVPPEKRRFVYIFQLKGKNNKLHYESMTKEEDE